MAVVTDVAFSIQSCRSCYATPRLCQRSFYKIFVKFRNSKKNVLTVSKFYKNMVKWALTEMECVAQQERQLWIENDGCCATMWSLSTEYFCWTITGITSTNVPIIIIMCQVQMYMFLFYQKVKYLQVFRNVVDKDVIHFLSCSTGTCYDFFYPSTIHLILDLNK